MNYLSNSKVIIFILYSIISSIFISCKEDQDYIPYTKVNIYININEPDYIDLTTPGNSIYITGGVRGIVIYRYTLDEFIAIERLSSYNPEDGCAVLIDSTSLFLDDPCSDSQFTISSGTVAKGPATRALKVYQSHFDALNNVLRIYN